MYMVVLNFVKGYKNNSLAVAQQIKYLGRVFSTKFAW